MQVFLPDKFPGLGRLGRSTQVQDFDVTDRGFSKRRGGTLLLGALRCCGFLPHQSWVSLNLKALPGSWREMVS